jgi:hypothetical protein
MREAVTTRILPEETREPNPYITAGTDVVGLVAPFAGKTGAVIGPAGSLASIMNDPSPMNTFVNVAPYAMAEDAALPLALVSTEADVLGYTAGKVTEGMINAIPGEKIDDGNGHTMPNPAFNDQNICQDLAGC